LLPALVAAGGFAEVPGSENPLLPSAVYNLQDLPAHGNARSRSVPIFSGTNHAGVKLSLHETDLAPGASPHPPHHHVNEEIFLMRAGLLEVTIDGKTSQLSPGSVAYVASNAVHGVHNAGREHALYFVLEVG
jgi:quercetin dioxygenase-like cupin family protein